jgi:hypothetical protein
MRLFVFLAASALVVVAMFSAGWITGRTGIGTVVSPDSLSDLERDFSERMQDVSLVGTFSVSRPAGSPTQGERAEAAPDGSAAAETGRGEPRPLSEDRYDIAGVEKVGDDLWRFNARMDCCGLDGSVIPIVVPLTFVGDTPMIMMTDTSLAGIGTFTVRLFFYEDRYAGTWQNGPVGGFMSGRIEAAE